MTDPAPFETGYTPFREDDEPVIKPFDPEKETNLLFLFRSARVRSFLHGAERALQQLPIFKDLFLIIRPASTWSRIMNGRHGAGFIFSLYLLPMMLLVAVVEGHGLMLLGRQQVAEGMNNRFTFGKVLIYETGSTLLCLFCVFVIARMIKSYANACHHRNHLGQSLAVMFQAVGPMFLIQLLNGFPDMYLWFTWFIGVTLAVGTLYHGLPRIMEPDPPSAMGLYCASAVVTFLVLFANRFLTYWYLIGNFKALENYLFGLAGDWLHLN